jgi:hypothetical protein
LKDKTEPTPVQSETGAKHVSDHAPQGDHPGSERKQKKMPKITDSEKFTSAGKAEMRLHRKGCIGDERGKDPCFSHISLISKHTTQSCAKIPLKLQGPVMTRLPVIVHSIMMLRQPL